MNIFLQNPIYKVSKPVNNEIHCYNSAGFEALQMRWWNFLNFENLFVKKKYFENVLVKMMKKIK